MRSQPAVSLKPRWGHLGGGDKGRGCHTRGKDPGLSQKNESGSVQGDAGVIQAAGGRGGQENIRGLGREMKDILFLEWEDYKNNRPE